MGTDPKATTGHKSSKMTKMAVLAALSLTLLASFGQARKVESVTENSSLLLGKNRNEVLSHPELSDELNTTYTFDEEAYKNVSSFGKAFLRGFKANQFSPNATQCFDNMVDFHYKVMPLMEIRMYYATMEEAIYNISG
jgi:hypothetical protein